MRFLKFLRPEHRKSDLDDEIAAHLALAAADKQEQGADAEAAQHEARREFGNVASVKDRTREAWGWVWLERLLQDARYALRQMRKSPGFAAAVIGTLALGIAAATTMFTVVDHVLFPPSMIYPHSDQLVRVMEGSTAPDSGMGVPYLDIAAWRDHAHSFQNIAFFQYTNGRTFLGKRDSSAQVQWLQVSSNYFRTFGIAPQLGPGLPKAPESFASSSAANTVVLSDATWRTVFGADPKIIGQTVQINGQPYTVTGVMPPNFDTGAQEAWSPVVLGKDDEARTTKAPLYWVIARLRPEATLAAAQAELTTMQKNIAKEYTDSRQRDTAAHVGVTQYSEHSASTSTRHALYSLLAAALLLWLIACVNSTNLLLARAIARQREMAMRGALGASRWRLTQQLIVESCILSGLAALLGVGIASGLIVIFQNALARTLWVNVPARPNLPVLAALVGLTLISAVLAAAWPAWIAAHSPIEPALKQGGQQSGSSRRHHRLRGGLVIAEIAMSLTLLAACGLMLRTLYALSHVPLGFRTDHIIVANLDIPTYRFSKINATADIYQPLLERVKHMPGIDSAGLMTDVPLGKTFEMMIYIDKKTDHVHGSAGADFKAVTPSLQHVFGFSMLAGRYFNAQDTASSEPVVVVNRAFAHKFAPDQQDLSNALGMKVMPLGDKKSPQATIIGIMDNIHQNAITKPSTPEIDVDMAQITPASRYYTNIEGIAMDLAVR
ncbi:MAG TPA: ABC transporter permease, partial [Acidobacteriaceae bacterium]|nr:ABC transporter permease [Acidobacteriaceae bacterium]